MKIMEGLGKGVMWLLTGVQLGNIERGRRLSNRKDVIIHGLSPIVKCVAPLFRDMSLARA